MKRSKRMQEVDKLVDRNKSYQLGEAVELLKKCPPTKFDQSLNMALKVGVDPKKSDQQVRGTVSLPHGTGQTVTLVVIAKGDKVKEALEAGADFAGADDLLEKIKGGWTDFSALISTPDMMRELGKLGKVLGPRGLMPTPKAGTVTTDVAKAVREAKDGKIEFKVDKTGNVHAPVGRIEFSADHLLGNLKTLLHAIVKARPSSVKGQYVRKVTLSSTMGPGVKIDVNQVMGVTE